MSPVLVMFILRTYPSKFGQAVPLAGLALAGTLGILSVVAWFAVAAASMPMAGTLDILSLLLFTAIWAVGMVAMMFPSLLPMVYATLVSARKTIDETGNTTIQRSIAAPLRATLFVLGYIAVWTLVGVAFYLAIAGLYAASLPVNIGAFTLWAGIILIATGAYQFTRFKQQALMKCRSPMSFIFTRWRNGNLGAGVMGADYGLFCTKCCWVLMAGLLTVGVMSLPAMGVFTIIIFFEKVVPLGALVSKLVGIAFLVAGLFLLFRALV